MPDISCCTNSVFMTAGIEMGRNVEELRILINLNIFIQD